MASPDLEAQRIVYIITYSRTDTSKCPTRESFSQAVIEAWRFYGINILHWVVSIEAHATAGCDNVDHASRYRFTRGRKIRKERAMVAGKEVLKRPIRYSSPL